MARKLTQIRKGIGLKNTISVLMNERLVSALKNVKMMRVQRRT